MAGRRIFLAIDISEAARDVCFRHIENLRAEFPKVRVGWERPEKLHITLRFLGDTADDVLERLQDGIAKAAADNEQFESGLARSGVFPSRSRPRILWIGADDPEGRIRKVHHSLATVCKDLGYGADDKSFRPHITIGRIRESQSAQPLADVHLNAEIEPVAFQVSDITIYQSQLRRVGSVYTTVACLPLGVGTTAGSDDNRL